MRTRTPARYSLANDVAASVAGCATFVSSCLRRRDRAPHSGATCIISSFAFRNRHLLSLCAFERVTFVVRARSILTAKLAASRTVSAEDGRKSAWLEDEWSHSTVMSCSVQVRLRRQRSSRVNPTAIAQTAIVTNQLGRASCGYDIGAARQWSRPTTRLARPPAPQSHHSPPARSTPRLAAPLGRQPYLSFVTASHPCSDRPSRSFECGEEAANVMLECQQAQRNSVPGRA